MFALEALPAAALAGEIAAADGVADVPEGTGKSWHGGLQQHLALVDVIYGVEHPTASSERRDAELLEILLRQRQECHQIDLITNIATTSDTECSKIGLALIAVPKSL